MLDGTLEVLIECERLGGIDVLEVGAAILEIFCVHDTGLVRYRAVWVLW